jgi:hypothetical protein
LSILQGFRLPGGRTERSVELLEGSDTEPRHDDEFDGGTGLEEWEVGVLVIRSVED